MFPRIIEIEVGEFLTSPTNTYVVFDGTATILFRGTMQECYVYREVFKQEKDYDVVIYAQETYDRMMKLGKESYEREKNYRLR
jgi:hypothetical protein